MDEPLMVEVLAYAPTAYYHCTHCEVAWREMGMSNNIHEEQLRSSLPDDLAQDYQLVSDWVREIFRDHCDRVIVKVIDVMSVEGVFKAFRHGARQFPAVVISRQVYSGRNGLDEARHQLATLLLPVQPG
jgi:hypothetical protein